MNLSTSFVLYQECPDDVGVLLELIAALAAEWLAPPLTQLVAQRDLEPVFRINNSPKFTSLTLDD
jgi:hypothetical protein